MTYSGEAQAYWPLWTAGFGVLVLVIVTLTARREIQALRPLLGAFVALGLHKRWHRSVLLPMLVTFAATCTSMALGGSLYALLLLYVTYSATVFDIGGIPWWMLLALLATIPLASAAAALLLTRKKISPALTQQE